MGKLERILLASGILVGAANLVLILQIKTGVGITIEFLVFLSRLILGEPV